MLLYACVACLSTCSQVRLVSYSNQACFIGYFGYISLFLHFMSNLPALIAMFWTNSLVFCVLDPILWDFRQYFGRFSLFYFFISNFQAFPAVFWTFFLVSACLCPIHRRSPPVGLGSSQGGGSAALGVVSPRNALGGASAVLPCSKAPHRSGQGLSGSKAAEAPLIF